MNKLNEPTHPDKQAYAVPRPTTDRPCDEEVWLKQYTAVRLEVGINMANSIADETLSEFKSRWP